MLYSTERQDEHFLELNYIKWLKLKIPQIKLNIFSNLQNLFLKRPDNILNTFKRRFILSIIATTFEKR